MQNFTQQGAASSKTQVLNISSPAFIPSPPAPALIKMNPKAYPYVPEAGGIVIQSCSYDQMGLPKKGNFSDDP